MEQSTRTNDLRKARAFHRRTGELLAAMEKAKAGRPKKSVDANDRFEGDRAQLEAKVDQHGKGPFQTPAHTRLLVGKLLDDLEADCEHRKVKNFKGLKSYLVRAGVPEAVAMRISGHRDRSTFDRYNITSETDLRAAAQKLQLYVDGLPTEREPRG